MTATVSTIMSMHQEPIMNATASQNRRPQSQPQLSELQRIAFAASRQQVGMDIVINDLLVDEILSDNAKDYCCAALACIDGRRAKWPMSLEEACVLAAVVSGEPTQGMSYQELRALLSNKARETLVELNRNPQPMLANAMTANQLDNIVRDVSFVTDRGQPRVKVIVALGEPCDGRNAATTGTIILGRLMRALVVSPNKDAKRLAMSWVLTNFEHYDRIVSEREFAQTPAPAPRPRK